MQYSHDLHYTVSACQSQTVFLHFPIFPFYKFLLPVFRALHFFFLYTKEIFLSIFPAARLISASLPDLSILRGHNLLYFSCPFLAYILLCGYSHVFHPQLSTYPQIVDKLCGQDRAAERYCRRTPYGRRCRKNPPARFSSCG